MGKFKSVEEVLLMNTIGLDLTMSETRKKVKFAAEGEGKPNSDDSYNQKTKLV